MLEILLRLQLIEFLVSEPNFGNNSLHIYVLVDKRNVGYSLEYVLVIFE